MAQESQNYENHARFDPLFHFVLFPFAMILFITAIVLLVQSPGKVTAVHALIALWACLALLKMRLYSMKVQDRVIRLEERLRLKQLLPAALQPRIGELTESQLIALRFASDAELPQLVEKTLAGNLDRKQIKQAIRDWRPDYWRV